jgi:hypothetical protein
MVRVGQRNVLKFLFLKAFEYKAAHKELSLVLEGQTYSLLQMKQWLRLFRDGDLAYKVEIGQGDHSRTLQMEFVGIWISRFAQPHRDERNISVLHCPQLIDSSKSTWDSKNSQEDGSRTTCPRIKMTKV